MSEINKEKATLHRFEFTDQYGIVWLLKRDMEREELIQRIRSIKPLLKEGGGSMPYGMEIPEKRTGRIRLHLFCRDCLTTFTFEFNQGEHIRVPECPNWGNAEIFAIKRDLHSPGGGDIYFNDWEIVGEE